MHTAAAYRELEIAEMPGADDMTSVKCQRLARGLVMRTIRRKNRREKGLNVDRKLNNNMVILATNGQ